MEYQSLKKLKRMDLLEMLIAQVEENERLLEKMEQLHFQLERQKTLSPREAGASGSSASAQNSAASAQGRAMSRSQGFAGSAGYSGSAGMGSAGSMLGGPAASAPSMGSASSAGSMASAGSAAAMALRSSAGSSASVGLTGSAGSLHSASGMKAQQSFAAGKQGSLSSAAPYAAESPHQAASYASVAQTDPYAPAPQADPYDPTSQASSYAQTPPNASPSRLDPYAPTAHADSYTPAAQNASSVKGHQTSQPAPYRSAVPSDRFNSRSPYYTPAAKTTPPNPQQETLSQHSCKRENTDPYEPFAPANPKAAAAASPTDQYTLDDQLDPYVAEHEPFVPSRATQPDRPREELNHPDFPSEEHYGRQPLSFGEKDALGVLPSFLQEMPREDQEDFSCSRVQPGREAQNACSASPYYKQNVVPLNPSKAGARTVNFAPASAAISFAADAGTPAAARQSQVRPLSFASEPGNAVTDKVNRSHA